MRDMETYEITETIKSLTVGDKVRIQYKKDRYMDEKSINLRILEVGNGSKPILTCTDANSDDIDLSNVDEDNVDNIYYLESNPHKAGYRLLNISKSIYSKKLISIQKIS